jgi:hypothetical protein
MRRLVKTLYSTLLFDCVFGVAGIIGLIGIFLAGGLAYPAIEVAASPLAKGAALVGVVLAGGALASQTTRIDQQLADDFVFQTLTKSALIGMMATIFALVLWFVLFQHEMGVFGPHVVVGVIVSAWSISYFFTRIRGTRA